jgi:pimeloyl-ACP methyl ester carboxylesterase
MSFAAGMTIGRIPVTVPGDFHFSSAQSYSMCKQAGVITGNDLAAVRLPVLGIAGLDSDPFLHGTPKVIAASVPGAELAEFPDCGHVTYAEQPDAFAEAVRAFARRVFR